MTSEDSISPLEKSGYKRKSKQRHCSVKRRALVVPTPNSATIAPASLPLGAAAINGPINLPPLTLATWITPLNSEWDLQFQFQAAGQVIPSPTNQTKDQTTISAEALVAISKWAWENPGPALLIGGGVVIGIKLLASLLESLSQPPRRITR